MANEFSMFQSHLRQLWGELDREKRWRAIQDAFIERRLELAGIPPLSESEKEKIRADITEKFPVQPRDWE